MIDAIFSAVIVALVSWPSLLVITAQSKTFRALVGSGCSKRSAHFLRPLQENFTDFTKRAFAAQGASA